MLAEEIASVPPKGRERPRIAPPLPARSLYKEALEDARAIGCEPFPWQIVADRYIEAVGPDGRYLYPEVCIVVGRQNGKTEKLVTHIVRRLRKGRRITHTAQNRELPREVFRRVALIFETYYPAELAKRPRFANGQEEILLRNGGRYRIVAPNHGARGITNDDLLLDEVRELDHESVAAAKPTTSASENPQIVYLSNAGSDDSEVLNALRVRSQDDPALAYLEWSASPDRATDDVEGWCEANPSIGHLPFLLANVEREHRAHRLAGTMAIFETEHLCRWVVTMRERLVDEFLWRDGEADALEKPRRPFMAVSMDPDGRRASVAVAYRQSDDTIALTELYDVPGDPIDTDALGRDLRVEATKRGIVTVGFDPMTDKALARWFKKTQPITGQDFKNASARFVTAVEAHRLRWHDVPHVTDDLTWTARKEGSAPGTFEAVRAKDDRPITAALAAVRAVWLASEAKRAAPRIY